MNGNKIEKKESQNGKILTKEISFKISIGYNKQRTLKLITKMIVNRFYSLLFNTLWFVLIFKYMMLGFLNNFKEVFKLLVNILYSLWSVCVIFRVLI